MDFFYIFILLFINIYSYTVIYVMFRFLFLFLFIMIFIYSFIQTFIEFQNLADLFSEFGRLIFGIGCFIFRNWPVYFRNLAKSRPLAN